jgi:hypothetical protein
VSRSLYTDEPERFTSSTERVADVAKAGTVENKPRRLALWSTRQRLVAVRGIDEGCVTRRGWGSKAGEASGNRLRFGSLEGPDV